LAGRKVVMTAGPTFEAIDPVRGITNISSGKMGYALARACVQAGAEVVLVSGDVALPVPLGVRRVAAASAQAMRTAVVDALPGADVFIGVAAVADYRPASYAAHKIKKSDEGMSIPLVPNPDILAEVAARADAPFCVGLAAESRDLDDYAETKRRRKKLPLLGGRPRSDGMGGDESSVGLFDDEGRHPLPRAGKAVVARGIVNHLAAMLAARRG